MPSAGYIKGLSAIKSNPPAGVGREHVDRVVARLAARQHGVVSRRQLLQLGVGAGALRRRVESGHLQPVHFGVYAVGHMAIVEEGRWMAAVLAAGPGAVLSHRTAGVLWGFVDSNPGPIHVTAKGCGRSREGLLFHRSDTLDPAQCASRRGIPLTTVARTLVDMAATVPHWELRRSFDEADHLELVRPQELANLCNRTRGRRGTGRLRALLRKRRGPLRETRSTLERRFLRFCRDHDIPMPAVNVMVAGYEVDCAWPAQGLVVELDGWAHHRGRSSFEGDRERDIRLQVAGQRAIRVTHRRLVDDPERLAGDLLALLRAAG
jgi:very-short-patch-repair endonuclease